MTEQGGSSERSADADSKQLRDADFSKLEVEQAEGGGSSAAGDEALKAKIIQLTAEVEEHKDKYLRALAELENYKKRALRERSELLKYQGERVLNDMLAIVDNLELALKHSATDPVKVREGLELIHKQFVDTLARWEVRAESGIGKEFDPSRYQAISKVKVEGNKPGTIVEELKRAYFYKDKLLRPGEVVIADGGTGQNEAQAGDASGEGESQ